jgi:hypothetical protein
VSNLPFFSTRNFAKLNEPKSGKNFPCNGKMRKFPLEIKSSCILIIQCHNSFFSEPFFRIYDDGNKFPSNSNHPFSTSFSGENEEIFLDLGDEK